MNLRENDKPDFEYWRHKGWAGFSDDSSPAFLLRLQPFACAFETRDGRKYAIQYSVKWGDVVGIGATAEEAFQDFDRSFCGEKQHNV